MALAPTFLDFTFLFKGILVGLAIAAPVGPVGLLCIRRTLSEGRMAGFFSGLGAATADLVYGAIAALGFTFIADVFFCCLVWLEFAGAALLLLLGIRTFLNKPKVTPLSRTRTHVGHFSSTFFLTLTNPLTFFAFLGIFSALGLGSSEDISVTSSLLLLLGVFIGSSLWWLALSEGITFFRSLLPVKIMQIVNVIAGTLLIAAGLAVFANALFDCCS